MAEEAELIVGETLLSDLLPASESRPLPLPGAPHTGLRILAELEAAEPVRLRSGPGISPDTQYGPGVRLLLAGPQFFL